MKRSSFSLLLFVLGLACGFLVAKYPSLSTAKPITVTNPAKGSLDSAFDDLGLRPGDLLVSVNGVKDQTMLAEMSRGMKREKFV